MHIYIYIYTFKCIHKYIHIYTYVPNSSMTPTGKLPTVTRSLKDMTPRVTPIYPYLHAGSVLFHSLQLCCSESVVRHIVLQCVLQCVKTYMMPRVTTTVVTRSSVQSCTVYIYCTEDPLCNHHSLYIYVCTVYIYTRSSVQSYPLCNHVDCIDMMAQRIGIVPFLAALLQCALQSVAVWCSALQCVLWCVTPRQPYSHRGSRVCCSVLQCVAVCVAVCCSVCCRVQPYSHRGSVLFYSLKLCCSECCVLQYGAECYSVLQCAAVCVAEL